MEHTIPVVYLLLYICRVIDINRDGSVLFISVLGLPCAWRNLIAACSSLL